MKLRFPSFKTTARILKTATISSLPKPSISSERFVWTKWLLSSSSEFVSLSNSYLLMLR